MHIFSNGVKIAESWKSLDFSEKGSGDITGEFFLIFRQPITYSIDRDSSAVALAIKKMKAQLVPSVSVDPELYQSDTQTQTVCTLNVAGEFCTRHRMRRQLVLSCVVSPAVNMTLAAVNQKQKQNTSMRCYNTESTLCSLSLYSCFTDGVCFFGSS